MITEGPTYNLNSFLAIDGEGGNDSDGTHHYMMLVAAGIASDKRYVLHTGKPLRTLEIFDWIMSLPQRHILIGFHFNYDVTMMLCRDVPRSVLVDLCERDKRIIGKSIRHPEWGGYRFDWIPGKFFVLIRGQRRRKIWDTAGFFQSSLVKALEGWGVGRDIERMYIESKKNERSGFTTAIGHDEITYATTECRLLCSLMNKVRKECDGNGFRLRAYSGAGSMAAAILDKYRVRDFMAEPRKEVQRAAEFAYFGGRFEASTIGPVEGPIYGYDIRSAYPNAMQSLPCLKCGHWKKVGEIRRPLLAVAEMERNPCSVWDIEWSMHPDGDYETPFWGFGPFPYRGRGKAITYPEAGRGWYWGAEAVAGIRMLSSRNDFIRIRGGWTYQVGCSHTPFGFIPSMYARRLELKEQGHLGERVLKLGLNSLYGKTAQSVGAAPYASMVWAGMITAKTRAMILDTTRGRTVPHIVMTCTDGIYSREPLDLDIGEGLGQWEASLYDDMFVIQPGLYSTNYKREDANVRSRGVDRKAFNIRTVLNLWESGEWRNGGMIEFKQRGFIGLRRGLRITKYPPGHWYEETKALSLLSSSKRYTSQPPDLDVPVYGTLMGRILTRPKINVPPGRVMPLSAAFVRQLGDDSLLDLAEDMADHPRFGGWAEENGFDAFLPR